MKRAAVLAVCLLAACGVTRSSHEATGTLRLQVRDNSWPAPGKPCAGEGVYSDIAVGAPVTVSDEAGKILATASLSDGKVEGYYVCVFSFAVDKLPDASFYQFEVTHRGQVRMSKAEMVAQSWAVTLTLGD